MGMLDAEAHTSFLGDTSFLGEASEASGRSLSKEPPDALAATVRDLVIAARRVLAAVRSKPACTARAQSELRAARAILTALGRALEDDPADGLLVAHDGTWFETRAGRVDVQRRGAVRRILVALATRRATAAGRTLSVDDLFQLGWPGEQIPYESQVRRVYTAIWTLRTLGLEDTLKTRDDGYLLDPAHPVSITH